MTADARWIRVVQERDPEGEVVTTSYEDAGWARKPRWAFWRKKEQMWRQTGPAKVEGIMGEVFWRAA